MALTYTITEKFPIKANGAPKYYTNDFINTNLKGISFFNTGFTLGICSTSYSYFTFDFTFTGTAKYVGVSFSSNSTISVGLDSLDNLFMPFAGGKLDDWDVKLTAGVTQRVYVIVNGDQNAVSTYLNVMCSTGNKTGTIPISTNTIKIDYNCNTELLYGYIAGLHVYSGYDSIYSPRLTTKLYSKQDITTWLPGTRVWTDAEFTTPAYPYFYGIGDYVYKVGDTLDRSYGTTEKYETVQTAWRQLWKKDPVINKVVTTGYFTNVGADTTSACVNVIMLRSGTIIRKEHKNLYPQPSKYKYLMGYSSTSKQDSNDLFFTKYLYSQGEWYPITGYHHSTYKLAGGYTKSLEYLGFSIPEEGFVPVLLAGGTALALAISGIVTIGGLMATAASSCPIVATAAAAALGSNPVGWIITLAIVAIVAIIGIIYTLFNKHRETYEELCKQFLHEYTTAPYILIGNPLSRTKNMLSVNNGYFCDGVYFYTQSGGVITVKELSSTNALISEDPIKLQFRYSLQADDPTLVTGLDKLMLLPYTSGIPVEWPVPIYQSAAISDTPTYTCIGDLMVLPVLLPSISLPLGFITSTISQADADFRALEYLQQAKLIASTYNYCTLLPGEELGLLESYFTHEIRVEQFPTTASCFYDNRNGLGLTIGKKLYYDPQGRILAMNGFYAIDGPNPAFRTFYHTSNGIVDGIYTMAASDSTIVTGTSTLSVITVNLEYTSNWYLTSINVWDLARKINTTTTPKTFNPNTLYSDTMLVRGYINQSHCMFYLYTDNYSSVSLVEAESSWYYGIIEWGHSFSWYYQRSQSIRLDIQEICLPSGTYNNALFGFYIIGMENGYQTAVFNNVTLTVNVYKLVNGNTVLAATYTVVTDVYSEMTYFPYDNQILPTDNINNIVITSINTAPQDCPNKITYSIGTFTNCNAPTTTTTTNAPVTTTTTTVVCNASLYYTYVNPTIGNNGYATIYISNGVPNYIYMASNGQSSQITASTSFIINGLAYNTPYTVTVYYNNGFSCIIQTIITLIPVPTTTTTTTIPPTTTTTTRPPTTTTTTTKPPTTTTTTTMVYYTALYSCISPSTYVTSSPIAYSWTSSPSSRAIDAFGNYYTVLYANYPGTNPWSTYTPVSATPVVGQIGCPSAPTTTTTSTTRSSTTTTTTTTTPPPCNLNYTINSINF